MSKTTKNMALSNAIYKHRRYRQPIHARTDSLSYLRIGFLRTKVNDICFSIPSVQILKTPYSSAT